VHRYSSKTIDGAREAKSISNMRSHRDLATSMCGRCGLRSVASALLPYEAFGRVRKWFRRVVAINMGCPKTSWATGWRRDSGDVLRRAKQCRGHIGG